MADRIDVFISSTSRDLALHRSKVADVILQSEMYPIDMANFNPTYKNALQVCYDKVQEAELFIGIYAYRYGYVPDAGMEYKTPTGEKRVSDGKLSVTHMEYQWALKRGIPMLLFLIDEEKEAVDLGRYYDEESEVYQKQLRQFKDMILKQHTVGFFHSADHLASKVAPALWVTVGFPSAVDIEPSRIATSGMPILNVLSHFRDRDDHRKEIREKFADPTAKVISLIGRGGIGKTAIASKVLVEFEQVNWPHEMKRPEIDGIVYLSTRTRNITLERIFLDCAELFNGEKNAQIISIWTNPSLSTDDKVLRLLDNLRDGNYVLLLDNMEEILDEKQEISDPDLKIFVELVLRYSNNLCLLITSRTPLLFSKEEMKFDHRVMLRNGLPEDHAIQVLRDLDPHSQFGLRDADEKYLRKIARKVDGVPRALEIVASILSRDPLTNLVELVKDDNISRVVEELARENFKNLNVDYRSVLEAIAVYGRSVTIDAIEFLLSSFEPDLPVRQILAYLIQIHIISFDRKTGTVWLHPIDRDYIYANTTHSLKELEKLAAQYYLAASGDKANWKSVEDLEPSFFAFEHLIRAEDFDAAAELLNEIHYDYLDPLSYHKRAFEMRQSLFGKISDKKLVGRNLGWTGRIPNPIVEYQQAQTYLQQALLIATEVDDTEGVLMWNILMAENYMKSKDYDLAHEIFMKQLNNDELPMLPHWHSWTLNGLRAYYHRSGDLSRAVQYGEQSLNVAIKASDERRIMIALNDLAFVYSGGGEKLKALEYYKESLLLVEDTGRVSSIGVRKSNIGGIYLAIGKIREAIKYFEEALSLSIYTDHRGGESVRMRNLSKSYRYLGKYEKGIEYQKQAILSARENKQSYSELTAAINLVADLLEMGNVQEARSSYMNFEDLIVKESSNFRSKNLVDPLIRYSLLEGYFSRVIEIFEDIGNQRMWSLSLPWDAEGIAFQHLGKTEEAVASFKQTVIFCEERLQKTSQLFEEKYKKAIALAGLSILEESRSEEEVFQAEAKTTLQEAVTLCSFPGVLNHFSKRLMLLKPFDDSQFVASLLGYMKEHMPDVE